VPASRHVHAVAPDHLLRGHGQRLAGEQPQAAHAVAADVHQRAAVEIALQADVARMSGVV
jgi:hypothetical protein